MLNCHDVSQLLSQSLDAKISFGKRVQLWMHLGLCRLCRALGRDLQHLHRQARESQNLLSEELAGLRLSDEARQRIQRLLQSPDTP